MNIARFNTMLTATAEGFESTFHSAGSTLKSFGSTATGVLGGLALFEIGKGIAEAAFNATVGLVHAQMEAIDSTAKLADSLGITNEALGGLQYAASYAGVSNEDLSIGLTKMAKSLADAQKGTGPAAAAFRDMGLDASQLINMRPEEALSAIADGMKNIQNPAERAAAIMAVFGKGGRALIPLLAGGSEGFAAAAAEADKFGFSLSRVDAAKVEIANDAMTKVWNVLVGVANTLAVQVSPFISAFAQKLSDAATAGDGMRGMVLNAFEWIVKAVATAADYLQLLPAGFHGFRATALEAIAGVVSALNGFGKTAEEVINFFGGDVHFTALDDLQAGLEQVAAEEAQKMNEAMDAFNAGTASQKAAALFDEIRQKSQESAQAIADNAAAMAGLGTAIENAGESSSALEDVDKVLQKLQDDADTARAKAFDDQAKADAKAGRDDAKHVGRSSSAADAPAFLQAGSSAAANFVAKIQAQQNNPIKQQVDLAKRANVYLSQIAARQFPVSELVDV